MVRRAAASSRHRKHTAPTRGGGLHTVAKGEEDTEAADSTTEENKKVVKGCKRL